MSFHVRQKVVCVIDIDGGRSNEYGVGRASGLRRGDVYTIAAIRMTLGNEVVDLVEPPGSGFFAKRFRPLVEDRKSVSFTIGDDPDSERWDNRKKRKEKV